MALTKEQFEKLHSAKVIPIEDGASRFSFRVECSCGVAGHFYTKQAAEEYRDFHLNRKSVAPY